MITENYDRYAYYKLRFSTVKAAKAIDAAVTMMRNGRHPSEPRSPFGGSYDYYSPPADLSDQNDKTPLSSYTCKEMLDTLLKSHKEAMRVLGFEHKHIRVEQLLPHGEPRAYQDWPALLKDVSTNEYYLRVPYCYDNIQFLPQAAKMLKRGELPDSALSVFEIPALGIDLPDDYVAEIKNTETDTPDFLPDPKEKTEPYALYACRLAGESETWLREFEDLEDRHMEKQKKLVRFFTSMVPDLSHHIAHAEPQNDDIIVPHAHIKYEKDKPVIYAGLTPLEAKSQTKHLSHIYMMAADSFPERMLNLGLTPFPNSPAYKTDAAFKKGNRLSYLVRITPDLGNEHGRRLSRQLESLGPEPDIRRFFQSKMKRNGRDDLSYNQIIDLCDTPIHSSQYLVFRVPDGSPSPTLPSGARPVSLRLLFWRYADMNDEILGRAPPPVPDTVMSDGHISDKAASPRFPKQEDPGQDPPSSPRFGC